MLSIRECIKGRYVIIPRIQICKVLERMQDGEVQHLGVYNGDVCYYTSQTNMYSIGGVQDGDVCLALGSV